MPRLNVSCGSQLLIPELWSESILDAYRRVAPPARMISDKKLRQLKEEAADIPQLADLHDALKELMWRRMTQGKLSIQMAKLKKSIAEVRPQKTGKNGRLRTIMSRLKF